MRKQKRQNPSLQGVLLYQSDGVAEIQLLGKNPNVRVRINLKGWLNISCYVLRSLLMLGWAFKTI